MLHLNNPAHLLIGQAETIEHTLIQTLQGIYCSNSCGNCNICCAIVERQFYLVEWIHPENGYTLEDLEPIFDKIQFALDPEQQFYFILLNAERLSISCANKLLKSLEEPPAGYHFILCSAYKDALLPTIISRCTLQHIGTQQAENPQEELLKFFLPPSQDFIGLYNYLEFNKFPEQHSISLLEKLLDAYLERYNQAITMNEQNKENYKRIIMVLEEQLLKAPMPGSNKLFWKNLFLQIQNIRN